ncbi:MAG: ExsB family transcriptional regulator [Candidatus Omnitrophota bacterium]
MSKLKEIKAKDLNVKKFAKEEALRISDCVGSGLAINALSGGVDSAAVTMLGHLALGPRLRTYFVENGLMRKNEAKEVVALFKSKGVKVNVVDAKKEFFAALKGVTDPEEKREAITRTFYKKVFGKLVKKSGAKFLLQGTILTDIDETVAGIKRQHNVFEQLGIDPQKAFGYRILEPLVSLRKDGVRKLAKGLGLPGSLYQRMPFPGPALSARVLGEVTGEKVEIIRKATAITENVLAGVKAFQYLAILHEDRVTGMLAGKREFGRQIEIRCWDSLDARKAKPTNLPYGTLMKISGRIVKEVPGVVSVTYNITSKPPSTIEAI